MQVDTGTYLTTISFSSVYDEIPADHVSCPDEPPPVFPLSNMPQNTTPSQESSPRDDHPPYVDHSGNNLEERADHTLSEEPLPDYDSSSTDSDQTDANVDKDEGEHKDSTL